MYNGGFIAHNILSTASEDIGLSVKCKIPCENRASKCSVYEVMSYEPAKRSGFPTGLLYFLWIYNFILAAVEA
jgi:hypothetical protein